MRRKLRRVRYHATIIRGSDSRRNGAVTVQVITTQFGQQCSLRYVKATSRAEKSVRSNRRRKRGLRRGRRRSRSVNRRSGNHQPTSESVRPPEYKKTSERNMNRVFKQLDWYDAKMARFKKDLGYHVKNGFKYKDVVLRGKQHRVFDQVVYLSFKQRFANLQRQCVKSAATAPLRTGWIAFLYKEFKWHPQGSVGVERVRSGILDELVRFVRPNFETTQQREAKHAAAQRDHQRSLKNRRSNCVKCEKSRRYAGSDFCRKHKRK